MGRVTAIIAAAGQGRRMAAPINKQFLLLKDKPVLAHTLEVFDKHPLIDNIIVVTSAKELETCRTEVLLKYNFKKDIKLVIGGQERQDSVYNGLKEVKDSGLVIIHDGARPFLSGDMISNLIKEAQEVRGVIVGVPVKDTIKVVGEDNFVQHTPDRSKLWKVQTPQCFEYNLLLKAHEEARREKFYGTDDASLIERLGIEIKMIEGSYENIKITTIEDLILGEAILERRNRDCDLV